MNKNSGSEAVAVIPPEYVLRAIDCAEIIEDTKKEFEDFFRNEVEDHYNDATKSKARRLVIRSHGTVSIFLQRLLGFTQEIYEELDKLAKEIDKTIEIPARPKEPEIISYYKDLRHKMFCHTALIEPGKETIATRYALVKWYVEPRVEPGKKGLKDMPLNMICVSVGNILSDQPILPGFIECISEILKYIDSLDDWLSSIVLSIAEKLPLEEKGFYYFSGNSGNAIPKNWI